LEAVHAGTDFALGRAEIFLFADLQLASPVTPFCRTTLLLLLLLRPLLQTNCEQAPSEQSVTAATT